LHYILTIFKHSNFDRTFLLCKRQIQLFYFRIYGNLSNEKKGIKIRQNKNESERTSKLKLIETCNNPTIENRNSNRN